MVIKGGKRPGSGRKPNSGKFKEPTKAIRVPESCMKPLTLWLDNLAQENKKNTLPLDLLALDAIRLPETHPTPLFMPLYECSVSAGFPSPADDRYDLTMDLNKHLVQNTAATFFVRASGESMLNAGIHNGDLLIVDRSLTAKSQDIVIAVVEGDLTVKRLIQSNGKTILKAENPAFSNIELTEDITVSLWGVVTNVIHSLR